MVSCASMNWIIGHIKWIMLISGVLTSTMVYAAVAPTAALRSTFGESLEGPVADLVVRNWGFLIALIGAMLIYGAFHPLQRPLVLLVGGASKAFFISLMFAHGLLQGQAAVSGAIDLVMVVLFALYLIRSKSGDQRRVT
jgi:hypothetical protein